MSRTYSDIAARVRVPMGFLMAALYMIFADPSLVTLLWGAIVAFAGLLLRLWSAGHLQKNRQLATGGPYAYTRNPLYVGSALAGIGFCIAAGQWWLYLLFVIFLSAVYWPVIRKEEAYLRQIFPVDFPRYAKSVPALFPGLSRPADFPCPPSRFYWQQYLANREYRAFIGYLVILCFLFVKMSVINEY